MSEMSKIPHDEIAHLAYLNWEKDGKPPGKDLDYWLEAECQLQAVLPLIAGECGPQISDSLAAEKNKPQVMRRPRWPAPFRSKENAPAQPENSPE